MYSHGLECLIPPSRITAGANGSQSWSDSDTSALITTPVQWLGGFIQPNHTHIWPAICDYARRLKSVLIKPDLIACGPTGRVISCLMTIRIAMETWVRVNRRAAPALKPVFVTVTHDSRLAGYAGQISADGNLAIGTIWQIVSLLMPIALLFSSFWTVKRFPQLKFATPHLVGGL